MMAELAWFDHAALGIDVQSLGLDDADMAKLAVASMETSHVDWCQAARAAW
jgi:hypothetical protein